MTIFQLAIANARTEFGQARQADPPKRPASGETHWQTWDMPTWRGTVLAACGKRIAVGDIDIEPTCPTCAAEAKRYNELVIE